MLHLNHKACWTQVKAKHKEMKEAQEQGVTGGREGPLKKEIVDEGKTPEGKS